MRARHRRTLRSRLSRTLVALGLLSVLLLAAVNFVMVRSLLNEGVRSQLISLRDLRSETIESRVDGLLSRAVGIARDPGVSAALAELTAGYDGLTAELDDAELDDLRTAYEPLVARYEDAGVEPPPIDDLLPASTAGRQVQHLYVTPGDGADLGDAGDGSAYSEAHARYHPFLRSMLEELGVDDLLLVANDSDEVVYSVSKRVDLGTDAATGAHREAGLGEAYGRLDEVGVEEAALVDGRFYLPASEEPLVHVAASIRDEARVIGALIVSVPISRLSDIVTADQNWDLLGLGDTGDAYVVGSDFTMRTIPRGWSEDPDAYVADFLDAGGDPRAAELMEFTGSPVRIQSVEHDGVETALDGEDFIGRVTSYHDRETLAALGPLDIDGVDWVMVTEQETGETRDELERYLLSIGLVLAVLLPVLAVAGILVARILARPVTPLVEAAGRIAGGRYDDGVPDFGRNELGDVARQLQLIADDLADRQRALEAEEQRISTMLGSVVPDDLVGPVRDGRLEVGDHIDTGTVIAISIAGVPQAAAEQDALLDLTSRLGDELTALADRSGVERLRIAADEQLFVAGRDRPGSASDVAATFAHDALDRIDELGDEFGLRLDARAGLSVGRVASGVLGSQQLSFGVWGDAFNRALDHLARAQPGAVVADASVVEELGADWSTSPLDDDLVVVASADVAG